MNSENFDAETFSEIVGKIKEKMNESIGGELTENLQKQSEKLKELKKWYEASEKGKDSLISEVTNELVSKLLENIPQRYFILALEEIEINTEDKEPYAKFDVNYKIDPIKPFLEFAIRVDGKKIFDESIKFDIKFSGGFKKMEVRIKEEKKKLCFGTQETKIDVFLTDLPLVKFKKPKKLVSKKFTIDLSKYCLN